MIDIQTLFQFSFWFDLFPNALSVSFERGFFLFFALFIVLGTVIRIVARGKKYDRDTVDVYRRIAFMSSVMGFTGLLWFFFTYEEIYIFGARFWFLLWILGFGYWIYVIWHYVRVILPAKQEARGMKQELNKYLPRKKRRS